MKNKLLKLLTLVLSLIAIACFAFACAPNNDTNNGGNSEQNQEINGGGDTSTHTHEYVLKYDKTNHWEECSCGEKKNSAVHSGGGCNVYNESNLYHVQ